MQTCIAEGGDALQIRHSSSPPPFDTRLRSHNGLDRETVEDLMNLPNTSMGISRFQHGNTESFDDTVSDLIQTHPDSPIGGYLAPDMVCSARLGTRDIKSCVTRPQHGASTSKTSADPKKPLEARSNLSKVLVSRAAANRHSSQFSERSLPMITAPQTPRCFRQYNSSATSGISVRDFATPAENPIIGEYSDVPTCMGNGLDGVACCELAAEAEGMVPCPLSEEDLCPGPDLCPERPELKSKSSLLHTPGVDGLPILASMNAENLNAPSLSQYVGPNGLPLDFPVDATGMITAPRTPKLRRGPRGRAKFLMSIRRSRAACLRTPVLSVVVGRQLAGPTKTALRAIAELKMPDLDSISAAPVPDLPASEIIAPVPVSV